MDGFQTFARSKCGVWFSVAGVPAARSFCVAPRLPARKKPAAKTIGIALHPGGIFMPKRLGNSNSRCQAFPRSARAGQDSTNIVADTATATASRLREPCSKRRLLVRRQPNNRFLDFGDRAYDRELFNGIKRTRPFFAEIKGNPSRLFSLLSCRATRLNARRAAARNSSLDVSLCVPLFFTAVQE